MNDTNDAAKLADRVASLVEAAKRAGADAADAVAVRGRSTSVSVRLGKVEGTEASESEDVSLRVFIGKRVASVSANASSDPKTLAERAVAMAKVSPEDPFQGLADPSQLAKSQVDLDLFDATVVSAEQLKEDALAAEEAALAVKGRYQFVRSRRCRRPGWLGACHLAWLRRPLCRLALFPLRQRHRWRGYGHGARL